MTQDRCRDRAVIVAKQQPKPISLRAYAKRRGVSPEAVSKAISDGRLRESVVFVDGQPKIASYEVATIEWTANTRPRIDNPHPHRPEPAQPRADDVALEMSPTEAIARYNVARALREESAARRESALADIAELEAGEKKGELVPVAEARADVIDKFTIVKTKILGVPTRVGQRVPHLAAEVVPVIDALLREVLEELAGPGDDGSAVEA